MTELFDQSPFDPTRERRVVIIADWLPPDFGAVGQYMQMRAERLAEQGHDVTLVGLSTAARSKTYQERGRGSLTEVRLSAAPVPRGSLPARMLWTIATNIRLILAAFHSLRTADGILFTGSPPFLIHLLVPLKLLWRGRLIYRITDFHPECLIAARDRPSRALSLLLAVTNFWRRCVDGFEVLGEDQRRRLNMTGVLAERITLVRDGSPVTFVPGGPVEPLPAELAGKCVLLYSGNYGVAHEVETVVRGYELHHKQGSGRVYLWLCATGGGAEEVVRRLGAAGLPFHLSAPVSLEKLPALLRAPAAHLVSLRDPFVGYVMPSKIYACLQSAKPVIFVGSRESDVDLLARSGPGGYWRISCGDFNGFAAALEALADQFVGVRSSS
ncbi:MAG: hypothetical protein ACK4JB_14165 [Reyranella sp.]